MSRPLRIEFAGALYHVMSRGNERANIVRDDHDRQKRLDWLRRTVETYNWRLHSFVLMTNHDHLLSNRSEDQATPQLRRQRHRPPLSLILRVVAEYFGTDVGNWKPRSRHDDASRAVAAHLARREFGYPAQETADALGYRSHGSVGNAILRIEKDNNHLQRDIRKLKAMLAND